ncbi:hypothetical protein EYF80_054431 [Liparis tanakae]|uniref:Uncharacterized protein n=1 Tax=Liparis tanakae TaxID=230148 RepID=A0A4Z2F2F6_9TELE|nr:hypothetical protein EYF80_054431 [Liparis tanakae]
MDHIVSQQSLRRCQDQARLVIPELLTRMEEGSTNLRDDFYGYLSAFICSIYGHRPGIDQHKTNRDFGGAQIFLTLDEFSWLERWIQVRKSLGPKNDRVFITKGDGPVKNMVRYFQMAWAQMGLPGRPTCTDIRTAVSAHARNFHTTGTLALQLLLDKQLLALAG